MLNARKPQHMDRQPLGEGSEKKRADGGRKSPTANAIFMSRSIRFSVGEVRLFSGRGLGLLSGHSRIKMYLN